MLKFKTVRQIQLQDWDQLVRDTYRKPYSFQQQDGCKDRGIEKISVPNEWREDFENTEIPFKVNGDEMGVAFETWLNTTPESTLEHFANRSQPEFSNVLFWKRNFYPSLGPLIDDLHAKGLLEAGEYIIVIDW